METITITRPVIVKVRVTDGYRKALAAEVHGSLARLDAHLKQIDVQRQRLAEMIREEKVAAALEQLEIEQRKALDSRRQLKERLKEIGSLAGGQEVIHGRVESLVDIKVGDRWDRLMAVEVVLEDGQVVEIRQ